LPYFKLSDPNGSPINYSDFIAKTKSALHYYKDNVNKDVNVLYYVGERIPRADYKNDPGYEGQQNRAHFVELVSALAIIDFLKMDGNDLQCKGGKPVRPIYKEFGIKRDEPRPSFSDFGDIHEKLLARPLSQFALFRKYMNEYFKDKAGKVAWSAVSPVIDAGFVKEHFYRAYLLPFFNDFNGWLDELSHNNRGFAPFVLDEQQENDNVRHAALGEFIRGPIVNPVKGLLGKWKIDRNEFDERLNDVSQKTTYSNSKEKLMDIFYKATNDILTRYYKMP